MKHFSFTQRQTVRLKAAGLFEQDLGCAEIGQLLGVARQTVSGWRKKWRERGVEGLTVGTPGPKSRLTDSQKQQILEALLQGPKAHGYDTELWTLKRIAALIQKLAGVSYRFTYVSELMRDLGWSCQRPQPKAKERNEEAIAQWVAEDWSRIKRGHKSENPP